MNCGHFRNIQAQEVYVSHEICRDIFGERSRDTLMHEFDVNITVQFHDSENSILLVNGKDNCVALAVEHIKVKVDEWSMENVRPPVICKIHIYRVCNRIAGQLWCCNWPFLMNVSLCFSG